MPDLNKENVRDQCIQFLETLGSPGFIVMGWKKSDGTIDMVQSVKKMKPLEYFKSIAWAMHEISKKL